MRAFAGDVARTPSAYTLMLGAADFALGPSFALAPYVENQVAREGRATAYVCRDFTCRAPTTDVDEMLRSIREEVGGE
jgi:uncharacterized protein YyaL (SSP411 family)